MSKKISKFLIHQPYPLSKFPLMSEGTEAMYLVELGHYFDIQKSLTSYATRSGGKIKTQTLIAVDPKTGKTNHIVYAKVLKQGE